ncbi:discoidin domain-containing protein, partial [Amycolatopsis pretoriensis]|uniref:discoidin domain-containing protein n=1 Tax=Amycolatopsis pretoriensis TaxID=218821 RepID=UPI0011780F2D
DGLLAAVEATVTDGFLVLLNLAGAAASGTVPLPGNRLYRGEQTVTRTGTQFSFALAAAEGRIEPPRFTLKAPAGVKAVVRDASRVDLTAPAGLLPLLVTVTPAGGRARTVLLPPRRTVPVVFGDVRPYPLADRALGRTTFPAEPLPPGMSSPAAAVDDDPATAWRPGPDGRMVVDLGAVTAVSAVELAWTHGRAPAATVELSVDGVTYATAKSGQARYVAVRTHWRAGDASLSRISVRT